MLLAAMMVAWYAQLAGKSFPSIRAEVELGRWYFYALTGMQLSLVLLVAPAVAAGAICEEDAKGVLVHLLVTDLSDAEIVLGILAARLAPVLGLVACAIPVACLAGLLGGVEPRTRDGVPGGRRRGGAGRLAGLTLSIATYATPQSTADLVWLTGCTVLLAGVAAALFAAAYLSFDRCLGRVSDWRDERAITSRERNTIRIPSWLSCGSGA